MSQFANLFFKNTPYDLKNLSEILDASYSDSFTVDEEIQKKSFSPSTIGYLSGTCPRRWVLAFRGAQWFQEHTSHSVDNMEAGTDAHARIQANFQNSDLKVIIEKELLVEDPPVRGFVDVIIEDFNGYNLVIEIKTTRTEAWASRRAKNKGPAYQVLQLLLYMFFLEEEHGLLLYEDKNDHEKLLIPVEMTSKNKETIEKVVTWMREVYSVYEEGKLPKIPFRSNSKVCKSCPLQKYCFSQPEGDTEVEVLKYEDDLD
jgi:CRISPR/Cas system-associated exonuclease Cas4 (RecB family)